jgi:prophage regulatory protein
MFIKQRGAGMVTQVQESLLRLPAVMDQTGLCRSSVYYFELNGVFPKRVAIGPRSVAWKQSEIQEWIESRTVKVAV